MKTRTKHRFLCLLLVVLMIVSLLPMAALAAEVETSTWEKVDLDKITDDDVVAITMTKGDVTYALPADKASNSGPKAVEVSVADTTLTTDGGADAYGWSIIADDGKYTLKTQAGNYLYVINNNNGVRIGSEVGQWSITDGYFNASDGTNTRYIGPTTAGQSGPDWRSYKSINDNIKGQTLGFWKLTDGETPEPTPTVVPTEEPTPDPTGEPVAQTLLTKLDAAPADGDTVVICHPSSKNVLTGTASGAKLAGTAAELKEDQIILTDDMAQLKVSVKEGVYTFALDGKYLTSGATGNSLSFADDAESDLAKWTLEQQADGTWYIRNVGAHYNGNYNQALEYYSGFTTYGLKDTAAYKFEFYAEINRDPVSGLKTGDTVAIFNDGNGKAVTATASGNKLAATDAALGEDGKITGDGIALFTVTVDDNGLVTFVHDGKYLTTGATGGSLTLADAAGDYSLWAIEDGGDGLFFVRSANAKYDGNAQYLEYYNTFTTYGKKATADAKAYAMSFRAVAETPDDPPQPTGETYGLTSSLANGDKVIIYNAASGMGVSSAVKSTYYLSGTALAPDKGVITTSDAAVVWDVTVSSDGTYTFTQGDKTFGGTQSTNSSGKTYSNIVLTDPAASAWTLEEAAGGAHYMFLGGLPSSKTNGHIYLEWNSYNDNNRFALYDYANPGTNTDFIFTFYKQGAEPEQGGETGDKGDLVTNLDDMVGKTVAIYSPGHKTAISSKPNGDWYLKAQNATVENGKVVNFTSDFVWTVTKNDDGTYSFVSYDDPTKIIGVWPSGNYAEVTVNPRDDAATAWTLTPAKTADCFYMNSPTVSGQSGPAYIEAFVRNEFEVFSGYFTKPTSSKFVENEFALQFYLVDPNDAVAAMDDGEWDGVLTKGEQYVIYNADAQSSVGLFDEANFSMKAIPTTIAGEKAKAGNGAYVFTVDTMGRYYTFKTGDKFLATNNDEELFLIDPNADGSAPETAKWFLNHKEGGYILYNKEASYNGTPVCIEYYSSVFSGWTFSTKNPVDIDLFNFYKVADGTKVYGDIVQDPTVKFDGENTRYIEQDYTVEATLDDLAPEIPNVKFTYTAGSKTGEITNVTGNDRTFSLTIPAADIDSEAGLKSFTVNAEVTNSYGITYTGSKTVQILDEPFFSDLTPRPNSQTGEEKRPVVSVKIGNVGENPEFIMKLNGKAVEAKFADGVLSYTPDADLADGRVTVDVSVKRADGVKAEKSWSFTVGSSVYQHYFGQLHSHTTYSDGSGTLDAALEYVAGLPKSANVQFVAFTDHSNYFDTTSAANPEDALNDKSLMTDASREKWETYKNTVASFNAAHTDLVAIAGFEMTWSGGPGHINTFDSDGLVSRNNAALNNKSGDAGMKLYYATINKGESLNQFNHPGNTFGNFTDFSYYNEETDAHMFLVEVGNGEGQIGAGGYYPSYEQYTMALDKGWHVAPTNNQDNHKGRWGNANDARDVVLATDLSEESIYDAIRNCRVYATEDKNLDLNYTVNGEPMGTIFPEAPEQLEVVVNVFDPDAHETISKVELIGNSGKVVHTWDNATDIAAGELTATITEPSCSYYYVRVTQADGDLAVTAPVWAGDSISVGIQDVACETAQPVVNQTVKLSTTLFNGQADAVKVKSLVYTTDGSKVLGTDTKGYTIAANGTLDVPFEFTPDVAKRMTIKVTAVIEVNGSDLTYTKDITISVRENAGDLPVTAIKDVQAQTEAGHEYAIVGTVTSNASGYDKDTAFFDCIYVQDETAGICCFPVSGEYKIGDKVHIEGYTDFYQGEAELQVEKIEIIGSGEVAPKETTAAAVNDGSVLGSLITVKGTVESFEIVNGLVQTIMVKDENGDVVRVFIDGYITTGKEVENLENGCRITVTGLASYDDTFDGPFPRIRIRDRADILCEHVHTLVKTDAVAATCEKDGNIEYWTCSICGRIFSDAEGKTEIAAADTVVKTLGHTLVKTDAVAATCEKDGSIDYWTCSVCGKIFSDAAGKTEIIAADTVVKAIGHDWDAGKVTKAPTTKAEGEMTYTCKRDPGHKKTEPIAKLDKCDGGKNCPSIKLADVDRTPDSWYHEAVDWAYVKGVTKGTSETAFSPDAACTRAQAVTFLWRAMGSPDPKSTKCDFTDVEAGAYYYKAVLWAVEHEITNGVGGNRFDPDGTCNRAQIVTFLWRAENKPAPKGAAKFPDVAAGTWYTDAVAWAVEHKITNGMPDGTFKPNDKCTRAQIVTFLWRDMTNK